MEGQLGLASRYGIAAEMGCKSGSLFEQFTEGHVKHGRGFLP